MTGGVAHGFRPAAGGWCFAGRLSARRACVPSRGRGRGTGAAGVSKQLTGERKSDSTRFNKKNGGGFDEPPSSSLSLSSPSSQASVCTARSHTPPARMRRREPATAPPVARANNCCGESPLLEVAGDGAQLSTGGQHSWAQGAGAGVGRMRRQSRGRRVRVSVSSRRYAARPFACVGAGCVRERRATGELETVGAWTVRATSGAHPRLFRGCRWYFVPPGIVGTARRGEEVWVRRRLGICVTHQEGRGAMSGRARAEAHVCTEPGAQSRPAWPLRRSPASQ